MGKVIQSCCRVRWIRDSQIACLPDWSGSRVSTATPNSPSATLVLPPRLRYHHLHTISLPYLTCPANNDDQHGLPRDWLVCAAGNPCKPNGKRVLVQRYPNEPRERVGDWSILPSERTRPEEKQPSLHSRLRSVLRIARITVPLTPTLVPLTFSLDL